MRLVGATNSFIRWPFFLEGLWLGILGSIIPVSIIYFGYLYLYEFFSLRLRGNFIQLIPVEPFVYQASLLVLLVGCFIGIWGSVMSTRRFLKI
jgi:cell division transport system permease protein